jgi:tetratricopeptide (TPR) repeat protein
MIATHFRGVRMVIVSLVLIALTGSARAAGDWPVKRGESHEPVPYRYDPAEVKKLPHEFTDDFPACTIYSATNYLLEADGTVEKITHEVTRLTGRKGIERLGEYRNIIFDPSYETFTLNEARVLKADGKVVPIEPKHVQLRDVATDFQVYDHDKQLVISFPSLEVGDTIEVKWSTRGKNPEHQGKFFTRYGFGDDRYPVAVDEIRIRLPKDNAFKHATTGGKLEPTVKDEGNVRTYHWRMEKIAPPPQDDNLPPKEELHTAVSCSTFGTWADVAAWKQKIRKDCWTCTPEVKTLVDEVTRGLDKPIDKARALTYWVRRHIRYVSMGEKHDYTPHRPADVLGTRYGDCKDQSQLLAVMLREVGIPVALATLGTIDDGQVLESVPSPWGTHAILLVTLDGKEHWIDTTASLAGWDYLPRDDRDRACYLYDEKGLRLGRTPKMTPEQNRTVLVSKLSVRTDGTSHCERHSEAHGSAAFASRADWVEVPPGERRRAMAAELQNSQSKAHLVRLKIDEKRLKDFDQAVEADIVYDVPGHFSGENGLEGSITDSRVWARILSVNLDYDRKLPLDLGLPFESVHKYSIELPPIYHFDEAPKEKSVQSKWGRFELKVRHDAATPRRLELEFYTRLDQTRVEPDDFDAFRKFHEEMFKAYRVWLSLETKLDAKDAPAVEALLGKNPGDVGLAFQLAKHYRNADQTKEARRVIRGAVERQPSNLRLRQMQVELAEGREEEEAAYAALIRLQPDDMRHPIALAERRLEHKDPTAARQALEPVLKRIPKTMPEDDKRKEYFWVAEACLTMARCCHEANQPAEALAQLEEAIRFNPNSLSSTELMLLKGHLHEKLKQRKQARETYQGLLNTSNDSDEAMAALIRLELGDNRGPQALPYLRRYSAAVSHTLNGLVKSADYYYQLGREDDAFELAERSRDMDFHPDAQRILGLVYLKRHDYAKALFHLDRTPMSATVLEAVIEANLGQGRLGDALKQADRIEALKEPAPNLRRTYALLLSLTQRRIDLQKSVNLPKGKAEAGNAAIDAFVCAEYALSAEQPGDRIRSVLDGAFRDGIEIGPAFALRGQLALERGRLTAALADAERAVTLSPQEARCYFVRGRVRLERKVDGALADLSKAADLSRRKDAAMLHWLATALHRAGAHAEALAAQKEAALINPRDEEIREQLKEFEKK